MLKQGWIVLDIDGTITLDKHQIPKQVVSYLKERWADGWRIAFATGRSYKFASTALAAFDFPFYLLPQNGSITLEMPVKHILDKQYIPMVALRQVEQACAKGKVGLVVYAGFEAGDSCYYQPASFTEQDRRYLATMLAREQEVGMAVDSFTLCQMATFPLLKCLGDSAKIDLIEPLLAPFFSTTKIRDPFVPGMFMLLITRKDVSKGHSFERLLKNEGRGEKVIAGGDDLNDLSLFSVADFKIAMPHAPKALLEKADLIAQPTSEWGIINALAKAIHS